MKLLLHICCGPCVCYPHSLLSKEGIDIVGLWYNPNIHPFREYQERMMAAGYFANAMNLEMIWRDFYSPEYWLKETYQEWKDGDKANLRCYQCWRIRLEETASVARDEGMDAFSTTLLYSKYQAHEMVKEIGNRLQDEYNVEFFYRDFRNGWSEGINISKGMGLYRQQYCGCIFSERDRYTKRREVSPKKDDQIKKLDIRKVDERW